MTEVSRFIDQIDADTEAYAFIESFLPYLDKIESHNHERPGRTVSGWFRGRLVAIAVVIRDDLNWSLCIKTKFRSSE